MVERIPMQTRMRLKEEHYRQERIMKHLEVGLQSRLTKETHCLKWWRLSWASFHSVVW